MRFRGIAAIFRIGSLARARDSHGAVMGDSISEGGVVEWAKAVGDPVLEDDVVVVLETDKVSIDVRSEFSGVLTAQHAEVDDTVLVGANLFDIDTSADVSSAATATPSGASEAAAPAASVQETTPVAAVAVVAPASPAPVAHGRRVPLIKFLGKRSLLPQPSASQQPLGAPVAPEDRAAFAALPPLFGRLPLSEAEIEAVDGGGGVDIDLCA